MKIGTLDSLNLKSLTKQRRADSKYVEQITLLGIQLDICGWHDSLQTGVNTQ